MIGRRAGVSEHGIPQFVLALQHVRLMPAVWETHLKPLALILDRPEDEHVLQTQGGRASVGLWRALRALPQTVAAGDVAEFLLGYVPEPYVPLAEDDMILLKRWNQMLAQCFRWAINWHQHEAQPAEPTFIWNELVERRTRPFGPLVTWRDELFALLDEIDTIVTPRIEFWYQQRLGDSQQERPPEDR